MVVVMYMSVSYVCVCSCLCCCCLDVTPGGVAGRQFRLGFEERGLMDVDADVASVPTYATISTLGSTRPR